MALGVCLWTDKVLLKSRALLFSRVRQTVCLRLLPAGPSRPTCQPPPAQPASPGPGRSGEHGQAEPLGLWDRKAGSSVGISPTALRGRRGDPGRGSRPGLSGFGKVWEVLQPPPPLPAPRIISETAPHRGPLPALVPTTGLTLRA